MSPADSAFRLPELLRSFGEQMRTSLKQNLIPHPGELGTGREEVIRQFLRKYLPPRFGVSTGFVFDAGGRVSQQADVIIFDASVCPQFEAVGGKMFYPCESVVSVGQVKSSLSSKREVADALENLRSAKMLDRSAGGLNRSYRSGCIIDTRENHLDQIFTFLFITGRSIRSVTMKEAFIHYLRTNERYLWPNVCFAFDRYMVSYFCDDGVCPNPLHALGFSASTNECSPAELLLRFYTLIARATAATNVSTFPYWEYLHAQEMWSMRLEPFDAPDL